MGSAFPVWIHPLVAAGVVVAVAGAAWWRARAVLADPAGPTLPERLQQWRAQHLAVIAAASAIVLFSGIHALWTIPALWLVSQAATHRIRRQVFGDTWSLGGQIRWNLRALAGGVGFWWIASLAPFAIAALGAPAWIAGVAGAVLLAWNHFHRDVVLAALGATPLDRAELTAAFEPVLARTTVPRPQLVRAGPRGALLANAFALPSSRGDVVIFLDGLLDHASPAETAGVLAHELGHLEDFAPRRVLLYAHGAALALGAALVGAAIARERLPAWATYVWFTISMGSLLLRALRSQRRERASDARAVELCGGDGEALVRALVTLHALSHVPRRFDPELERHATHPSLARRIAAIRAISGVAPAAIEPRAFGAAGEPSRAILFEADRLTLVSVDGPADLADLPGVLRQARQIDAVPYAELIELRLTPQRHGGALLIAADRRRVRRRFPIAAADVAAAQALLDLADQRMTATPEPSPHPGALDRIAVATAAILVLPMFVWSVVLTALLACVRPTAPLLGAVSAGLLVTNMLPGRHGSTTEALVLGMLAVTCGSLAVRQLHAQRRAGLTFTVDAFLVAGFLVTGAAAAIPTALILLVGRSDPTTLHMMARALSPAAAGCAALGAYCAVVPGRLSRTAAAGALTAMAAILAVGSDTFRDRMAPDPLIGHAPALAIDELPGTALGTLSRGGSFQDFRLAPDARHVVLKAPGRDDDEAAARFVVASFDGWQREIDAHDVQFVDASLLFVERVAGGARILTAEPIREATPRWSLRLEEAPAGPIEVDASGRWRLERSFERDRRAGAIQLEGRIGESTVRRISLPPTPRDAAVERRVSGDGAAIQVARRWTGGGPWSLFVFSPYLGWSGEIERIGGRTPGVLARSRASIECLGPSLASASATCLATTVDETTFVWEVSADAGPLVPTAFVIGPIAPMRHDRAAVLFWRRGELVLLWRGTNRAIRVRAGRTGPHDAAYANGRLATLTYEPDRSTVRLYAVTPPRAPVTTSAAVD